MSCSISQTVDEGSACFLQVEFFDPDDVLAVPSTVDYRIDCLTTGNVVKASTSLTPASSIQILVTSSDNQMQDATNATERRQVTVSAGFGAGDSINKTYTYQLQNIGSI